MDWDKVCAYKTLRIVRIKDRFLGMVYWGESMFSDYSYTFSLVIGSSSV